MKLLSLILLITLLGCSQTNIKNQGEQIGQEGELKIRKFSDSRIEFSTYYKNKIEVKYIRNTDDPYYYLAIHNNNQMPPIECFIYSRWIQSASQLDNFTSTILSLKKAKTKRFHSQNVSHINGRLYMQLYSTMQVNRFSRNINVYSKMFTSPSIDNTILCSEFSESSSDLFDKITYKLAKTIRSKTTLNNKIISSKIYKITSANKSVGYNVITSSKDKDNNLIVTSNHDSLLLIKKGSEIFSADVNYNEKSNKNGDITDSNYTLIINNDMKFGITALKSKKGLSLFGSVKNKKYSSLIDDKNVKSSYFLNELEKKLMLKGKKIIEYNQYNPSIDYTKLSTIKYKLLKNNRKLIRYKSKVNRSHITATVYKNNSFNDISEVVVRSKGLPDLKYELIYKK